jgi:hypothetical protein
MTRLELRHEAERKLVILPIGGCAYFNVPKEQPGRRILLQTLNQVAHATFGPRCYRVHSTASGTRVTRTYPMTHPVSQRRLRDALDRRYG